MIKTTMVAMTLLGCDCDAKVCEYVADATPRWESMTSCEAAIRGEAVRRSDLDYPLLTGECRVVSQPAMPELVALSEQAQTIPAEFAPEEPNQPESSRFTFVKTATGYVSATGTAIANGVGALAAGAARTVEPTIRGAAALLSIPIWSD